VATYTIRHFKIAYTKKIQSKRYSSHWYCLSNAWIGNGGRSSKTFYAIALYGATAGQLKQAMPLFKKLGQKNVCRICLILRVILPQAN